MNELIDTNLRSSTRRCLMAGTCVAVLLATSTLSQAHADDAARPTVWIELGGQLERVDGGVERFAPPFLSDIDTTAFASPLDVQRPPRYATGFEGNVTFQPEDSDWEFSAAVRYGRSNKVRKLHQEGAQETARALLSLPAISKYITQEANASARRYVDTIVRDNESHTIVDFQVGKDVGFGLFGRRASSTLSAGLRFAQFQSRSNVTIAADPDFAFAYFYPTRVFGIPGYFKLPRQNWHLHRSGAELQRGFHGIGPSVTWDGSASVLGNSDGAELSFDWGLNGAVLFGRQKMKAHHETRAYHHYQAMDTNGFWHTTTAPPNDHDTARTRSIVVPNFGGFAGLSLKFPNAKVSLGYRADMFFGAVDGGIDARKSTNRTFHGPFASFSVGLGG